MKYPKKPKYSVFCQVCGKEFKVYKYRIGLAKYCGHECFTKIKIGKHLSKSAKEKLSKFRKAHPLPHAFKKGHKTWNTGHINSRWVWTREILKRDNHTCKHCGKTNTKLNAHHIKPFTKFPKLRFELSNGITLCQKCHYNIHWH